MKKWIKGMVTAIAPPILYKIYHKFNKQNGWFGNFSSWDEAQASSEGYNSSVIVEKVKNATLEVKKGLAAFERDSVLFYEKEYSWPLLSALFWVAAQKEGNLRVIDFGGSLGSTYFQYRHLFEELRSVKWHIIEQESFYQVGKDTFEDERLKFFASIASSVQQNKMDVVLLGCVLPYVERPFEILNEIFTYKIPFLILDRMPFIEATEDRLTVQRVPAEIYQASYPAWFFSYQKFISFVSTQYELVTEYPCEDVANIKSAYKGLILKIKE